MAACVLGSIPGPERGARTGSCRVAAQMAPSSPGVLARGVPPPPACSVDPGRGCALGTR